VVSGQVSTVWSTSDEWCLTCKNRASQIPRLTFLKNGVTSSNCGKVHWLSEVKSSSSSNAGVDLLVGVYVAVFLTFSLNTVVEKLA